MELRNYWWLLIWLTLGQVLRRRPCPALCHLGRVEEKYRGYRSIPSVVFKCAEGLYQSVGILG